MQKPEILIQIRNALRTNRSYEIAKDFGWVDGGCWMLANAIAPLLPGSKAIAIRKKGDKQIEHVATSYQGWIIDGTGVYTPEQFRKYWEWDEIDGIGPIMIAPFDLNQVPGPRYIDPYRDRAKKLGSFIRQRMKSKPLVRVSRRSSVGSKRHLEGQQPTGISGLRE